MATEVEQAAIIKFFKSMGHGNAQYSFNKLDKIGELRV